MFHDWRYGMGPVLEQQKSGKLQIDEQSFRMVGETTEFWGIAQGSNHSSESRSSHSTYPDAAKNKDENERKNDNTLKRLVFVFISCSTKRLRMEAGRMVIRISKIFVFVKQKIDRNVPPSPAL